MERENLQNRPLSEEEKLFKQAWEKGPKSLWEKPMSFSAYDQYVREGIISRTETSHYYKDKTRGGRGVTIEEIAGSSQTMISLHQRYSYPVLHNHGYVEIIYVATGCCVNLFETTSFPMKTGDVCILSPNSLHAISCTDDESCILNMMVNRRFVDKRFLNLLRGGNLLVSFMEDILFGRNTSPYILFPTGDDTCLQSLADAMIRENTARLYAYEYSISLLIGQFLLHLVREFEERAIVPGKSGNTQNELIVGILSYLNVHYNHTSLNETAQYFGYAPAYLSRMIREQTGKTFNAIIAQIQVEQAKHIMDEGNHNLTEIAQEIGCFDTSHFNKKFKAACGISPREYLASKNKSRTS